MIRRSRTHRFVGALLRDRRPPRFEAADPEDAAMLRVATSLRGARTATDLGRTFGEVGAEEKDTVSHRARAIARLTESGVLAATPGWSRNPEG